MMDLKEKKTPEELFDLAMAGRGGRLDTSKTPTPLAHEARRNFARSFLEGIGARSNEPDQPVIHFDYYDSKQPNAVAFSRDGYDFVGMSRELAEGLYFMFGAMLEDGSALRFLGLNAASFAGQEEEISKRLGFALTTRDEADLMELMRVVYAHILEIEATRFLLLHEIAHLHFGHVAYLQNRAGDPMLFETAPESGGAIDALTRQTLEWDADSDAVCQSLYGVLNRLGKPGSNIVDTIVYESARNALFTWIMATYGLFRCFVMPGSVTEQIAEWTHPPASVRQHIALSCAATWLLTTKTPRAAEMVSVFELAHPVAIDAVEKSWDLLFPTNPGNQGFLALVGDEGRYYLSRYEERWAGLYNDLLPFARIPLVKPNPAAWPSPERSPQKLADGKRKRKRRS